MKLPEIKTFELGTEKEQVLKPLEESSEVYGAFQNYEKVGDTLKPRMKQFIFYEIADSIQALCNLAAHFGCDDLTPYLEKVEESNRKRGRYGRE